MKRTKHWSRRLAAAATLAAGLLLLAAPAMADPSKWIWI
jgi:hypothetical protein